MNWHILDSIEGIEAIKEKSNERAVLLFKHSTRCGISSMALNRIERSWKNENIEPYLLDLIRYREVSNEIEKQFKIEHQSPQAILIKEGKVVYHNSHMGINLSDIEDQLN